MLAANILSRRLGCKSSPLSNTGFILCMSFLKVQAEVTAFSGLIRVIFWDLTKLQSHGRHSIQIYVEDPGEPLREVIFWAMHRFQSTSSFVKGIRHADNMCGYLIWHRAVVCSQLQEVLHFMFLWNDVRDKLTGLSSRKHSQNQKFQLTFVLSQRSAFTVDGCC